MNFAEFKHRTSETPTRKYSDAPYYTHPFRVMFRIRDSGLNNENLLAAALLHDTLEDTKTTFEELETVFNQDIAFLVLELTQPDKLDPEVKKLPRNVRHGLLLDKLKGVSLNAKRIKYYDRLDNLSEVRLDNPECYGFLKKRYLQESFDICRF